jgi:hypothetical protein
MADLALVLGGAIALGLIILLARPPSEQDESHRASESDMDSEDF